MLSKKSDRILCYALSVINFRIFFHEAILTKNLFLETSILHVLLKKKPRPSTQKCESFFIVRQTLHVIDTFMHFKKKDRQIHDLWITPIVALHTSFQICNHQHFPC